MSLTISRRVLRWLAPKQEERRRQFRLTLAKNMATAEDLDRTIKTNGFDFGNKFSCYDKIKR
jgi:hypothetical protein